MSVKAGMPRPGLLKLAVTDSGKSGLGGTQASRPRVASGVGGSGWGGHE